MESLQAAVCEDNIVDRENLVSLVEACGLNVCCTTYESGEALLAEYIPGKFDLIFMDVYMGGITGIKTVARVREMDEDVVVAFTTSSTEHALESYRLDALKYLEKPVSQKAVRELLQFVAAQRRNVVGLYIKIGAKEMTIPFSRITFVEQQAHTLRIHLASGEVLQTKAKLDQIAQQFDEQQFCRCHKSYLVNFTFVEELNQELRLFSIRGGGTALIRRDSLVSTRRVFENYLFCKTRGRRACAKK